MSSFFNFLSTFKQNKERRKEITHFLYVHGITKYTINADLRVDVYEDVFLWNAKLTRIPVKFNKVHGSFYCDDNMLSSLDNCPRYIKERFSCSNNCLKNLEFGPEVVDGDFNCDSNQISSFDFLPSKVGGDFKFDHNPITADFIHLDSWADIKRLQEEQLYIKAEKNKLTAILHLDPTLKIITNSHRTHKI